jgi:hypothetical protein
MKWSLMWLLYLSLGCSTTTLHPRPSPVESALYRYARETGREDLLYDRRDPFDLKRAARRCEAGDEFSCANLLGDIWKNETKRRVPNVMVYAAVCDAGRGDACDGAADLLRGYQHVEFLDNREAWFAVRDKPYTDDQLSYRRRACLADRFPDGYACLDVAKAADAGGRRGEALFYSRRACSLSGGSSACRVCHVAYSVVDDVGRGSPELRQVLRNRLRQDCPQK